MGHKAPPLKYFQAIAEEKGFNDTYYTMETKYILNKFIVSAICGERCRPASSPSSSAGLGEKAPYDFERALQILLRSSFDTLAGR